MVELRPSWVLLPGGDGMRLVGQVSPDRGGWVDDWMIIFGDIALERCVWFHCCCRELPSIGDLFRRFLRENRVAVETVLSFRNQCLPKRIFGVTASCTSAISCTNARQCSWTETVLRILRSHCTAHHFTPAQHFTPALPRRCMLAVRAAVQGGGAAPPAGPCYPHLKKSMPDRYERLVRRHT
jgi:hypothetical protein